jgi:uncharacterized protein YcbX
MMDGGWWNPVIGLHGMEHLSSVICHLSSVICHLSSVISHPSSVIRHPSSVICHPLSAVPMPSISSLFIYPLKSARGVAVTEMELDERGPVGDRRWMLVDDGDRFISLRELPRLAFLEAALTPAGLRLSFPNATPIEVRTPSAGDDGMILASLWDDSCTVRVADAVASAWLSDVLGVRCRLVYQPSDSIRPLPHRNRGRITEPRTLALTDGAALLVTSEASLADLNARLASPIPMSRFRPSIVVEGTAPYEEDTWHRVAVGSVELDFARGCPRCVATTVDQRTGEKGIEPLRTLSTYRRAGTGVLFGQNVTHLGAGRLRVGDGVRVID